MSFPRSAPGTLRPHEVLYATLAAFAAMSISAFVPAAMEVTTLPVAAGTPSSYEPFTTKDVVPGLTTLYE